MFLCRFSQSSATTSVGTTKKDSLGGGSDTIIFEDLPLKRNARINVWFQRKELGLTDRKYRELRIASV